MHRNDKFLVRIVSERKVSSITALVSSWGTAELREGNGVGGVCLGSLDLKPSGVISGGSKEFPVPQFFTSQHGKNSVRGKEI